MLEVRQMAMKKRTPRGGFVPDSDQVEEEMTVICISADDCRRLRGGASRIWGLLYGVDPSAYFSVKIRVPKSALESMVFHPAYCKDLDAVVKQCAEALSAVATDLKDG